MCELLGTVLVSDEACCNRHWPTLPPTWHGLTGAGLSGKPLTRSVDRQPCLLTREAIRFLMNACLIVSLPLLNLWGQQAARLSQQTRPGYCEIPSCTKINAHLAHDLCRLNYG